MYNTVQQNTETYSNGGVLWKVGPGGGSRFGRETMFANIPVVTRNGGEVQDTSLVQVILWSAKELCIFGRDHFVFRFCYCTGMQQCMFN